MNALSLVLAINPPQTGKFPKNILQKLENQGIGFNYGDEGWINKIAELKSGNYRDAQAEFNLPVLLGRYSDTQNTYFSANDFQNLLFDNNSTAATVRGICIKLIIPSCILAPPELVKSMSGIE